MAEPVTIENPNGTESFTCVYIDESDQTTEYAVLRDSADGTFMRGAMLIVGKPGGAQPKSFLLVDVGSSIIGSTQQVKINEILAANP